MFVIKACSFVFVADFDLDFDLLGLLGVLNFLLGDAVLQIPSLSFYLTLISLLRAWSLSYFTNCNSSRILSSIF